MTPPDIEAIQNLSKALWGAQIWRVRVNIQHRFEEGYAPADLDGVFLDFSKSFGNSPRNRQIGSVWIDVNRCGMRLENQEEILMACQDSPTKILAQLPRLVGSTLDHVEVAPPAGDAWFRFDTGLLLRCFPVASQRGDCWLITLEGNAFTAGSED